MKKADSDIPHFITFEGGEGAGKTTLIDRVEQTLLSWKIPVVRTREPGGTLFGEQIREWLLSHSATINIRPKTELLLFLAARSQHIDEVISPAIYAGKVVICDRFNDSTIAYQGAGRNLGTGWVKSLCDTVCGSIVPDLTLYLDVHPITGLARTRKSAKENACAGEVDRIESEDMNFHHRVRNAFLEIAKSEPNRFHCIDANQPKQAVIDAALSLISERFGKG